MKQTGIFINSLCFTATVLRLYFKYEKKSIVWNLLFDQQLFPLMCFDNGGNDLFVLVECLTDNLIQCFHSLLPFISQSLAYSLCACPSPLTKLINKVKIKGPKSLGQ